MLVTWYGVLGNFIQTITTRPPAEPIAYTIMNFFSHFTVQSNLLVALWLSLALWRKKLPGESIVQRPVVRGAVTVYITVTYLIYGLVLASSWMPTNWEHLYSNLNHYIVPLAFILDWFLFEDKRNYHWVFMPYWMIYPIAYLVYTQVFGTLTGNYMYFFLDRARLGWGGLAGKVGLLTLFFLALEAVYILVNRVWPVKEVKDA
jgi:hypothetical protein